MDKCVFVHTNERQWLGALVAEYSFRRNSAHADKFDVKFIHTRDYPYLYAKEVQTFLRGGTDRVWHMEDLQSFTPLRFMPPKLMSWQGRAVVTDPDVFAAGDVYELLTRDMGTSAVMGRHRSGKSEKESQVVHWIVSLLSGLLRAAILRNIRQLGFECGAVDNTDFVSCGVGYHDMPVAWRAGADSGDQHHQHDGYDLAPHIRRVTTSDRLPE